MGALKPSDKELAAAIEAARIEARKCWPGAYVSVVSYGLTNKGALGWSMRVDADADASCAMMVRVIYAGPTCGSPLDAVKAGCADPLYVGLRERAARGGAS